MLPASVNQIAITPMGFAAIIQIAFKEKIIPIFIGPSEAHAISTVLQGEQGERPGPADLMLQFAEAGQVKLDKVFIRDFQGGTFFAQIYFQGKALRDGVLELDARPSDAIALAVRFRAPIYVAEHVFDRTGVDVSTLREAGNEALQTGNESSVDELLTAAEREELFESILEEFAENRTVKKKEKSETKVEKVKFQSHRQVLQQMLKTALLRENYEEAARIRDDLRSEPSNL